ncbi:MAG: S8 family serine peptidase, partial [Acidimicrobiia bacterium]
VVDTGVSHGGEDLNCQQFVAPFKATFPQATGQVAAMDDHGHGTHVAGTIAQCTDNGLGVAGVAFDASLMPVKVLDNGVGYTSTVARGIEWARVHGADVINLSLTGGSSQLLDDAIALAVSDGIVVVAAAGNAGTGTVAYPASHPSVIAVGATDFNNSLAPYSNWGAALDVVAPGGDNSQDANGDGWLDGVVQETFVGSLWGYYPWQGTSMATPHVAGTAALLKAVEPGLDQEAVRAIISGTALDLGPSGFDPMYGHGLLQAREALEFLTDVDVSVPTWSGAATLGVESITSDSMILSWPDAIDDKVVSGYRVYRNGVQVAVTHGGANSYTTSGLASLTEYDFAIRAEDPAGNLSSPLEVTATTLDGIPPLWPQTATASVTRFGERELTISWGAAADNVGVTGYMLRLVDLAEYKTQSSHAVVSGLEPGKTYPIEVLARDAAGNWSTPLRGTVRTARSFGDTQEHTFYEDVLWMSGQDITRGCNPPLNDRFCPDGPVTRGQMAAFVARMLGLSANTHPGFGDVPENSTFAADIGKLATSGITRGCNPPLNDRFCPEDPLTRGQLAAFLHRASE